MSHREITDLPLFAGKSTGGQLTAWDGLHVEARIRLLIKLYFGLHKSPPVLIRFSHYFPSASVLATALSQYRALGQQTTTSKSVGTSHDY
jgi:hypothetical protein